MRGVDQRIDAFRREMRGQALRAAEAADPHRHRLRGGICGAARQRQHHGEIAAFGQAFRQPPRFRGAAENKDASHVAP